MYIYIKFYIKNHLNMVSLHIHTYNEVFSPLDQFEVRDLLSLDLPILGYFHISITNIGFYLTLGALFIIALNLLSTNYNKLVSNK